MRFGADGRIAHICGLHAIGSFLICIPLAFYYNLTNGFLNELENGRLADWLDDDLRDNKSEIFFMLIMPLFFTSAWE